jgi:hypothetical protein
VRRVFSSKTGAGGALLITELLAFSAKPAPAATGKAFSKRARTTQPIAVFELSNLINSPGRVLGLEQTS